MGDAMDTLPSETARTAATGIDAVVVGAGFAGLYTLYRLRALGLRRPLFRGRNERRRDLVLEPLSRRAVRRGEHAVFVLVLRRAAAGVAVERALRRAAGDPALRSTMSPTGSTCGAHPVRDPGHGRPLRRGDRASGGHDRARRARRPRGSASWRPVRCRRRASRRCRAWTSFAGRWFHTGGWPQDPVDFTGQRVGVIGTGSSGIQTIPVVARQAAHLYRVPAHAQLQHPGLERAPAAGTPGEWKADYPAHRAQARDTNSGILYEYGQHGAFDVSHEERRRSSSGAGRGAAPTSRTRSTICSSSRRPTTTAAEFVRARIRATVDDPAAAAAVPTDHPIGTKRICVDTDYFETFNRDNVTLVDMRAHADRDGDAGRAAHHGGEIALDSIVFATGYDAVTGALARIDITRPGGTALTRQVGGRAAHLSGPDDGRVPQPVHRHRAGQPVRPDQRGRRHRAARRVGRRLHRPRASAGSPRSRRTRPRRMPGWTRQRGRRPHAVPAAASWYMGANIPGKPRVFLPYVGGLHTYTRICEDVAANGYRGFHLRAPAHAA